MKEVAGYKVESSHGEGCSLALCCANHGASTGSTHMSPMYPNHKSLLPAEGGQANRVCDGAPCWN